MSTSVEIPEKILEKLPSKKIYSLEEVFKVYISVNEINEDEIDSYDLQKCVNNDSGKRTAWRNIKSKI